MKRVDKVIILRDKNIPPSKQISRLGLLNNYNGYRVFDTILNRGLTQFRFIEAYFNNGVLDSKKIKYIDMDDEDILKVNEKLLSERINLEKYLTNSEIEEIKSSSLIRY